jgi:hypothetical protein
MRLFNKQTKEKFANLHGIFENLPRLRDSNRILNILMTIVLFTPCIVDGQITQYSVQQNSLYYFQMFCIILGARGGAVG